MEKTLPLQVGLLTFPHLNVLLIVVNLGFTGVFCMFGIVLNAINIVVFLKQGLSNTVNISMFAIAVSDLCGLITLLWTVINFNSLMINCDLPYHTLDIVYLTGAWPHTCFLQITIWITVYVTAERFVCIALPLKVKQIFTPFRTKVVISLLYLIVFLAASPEYSAYYYGEKYYPTGNNTKLGLRGRYFTQAVEEFVYMLFAAMRMMSFLTLALLTCLLVASLKRRLQWRRESTTDQNVLQSMTRRDVGTMKMVILIAGVLVICLVHGMVLAVLEFLSPNFHINGRYGDISMACWSFAFFAEAVNSSINFVFFYKMSSNYKRTLQSLLPSCGERSLCGT